MKASILDKVFSKPERRVMRKGRLMCLKPNFKEICKKDLETELKDEISAIELREMALVEVWYSLEVMQNYPKHYIEGMFERALDFYTREIDSIFYSMHRIVYFEGLLNTHVSELLGDSHDD